MKPILLTLGVLSVISCGQKNKDYRDDLPTEPDFDSTSVVVKDSSNGVVLFQKPMDSLLLKAKEKAKEKEKVEEKAKMLEKENKEKMLEKEKMIEKEQEKEHQPTLKEPQPNE